MWAKKPFNINNFRMPTKGLGEGSNSLEWWPSKQSYSVQCTPKYVALANSIPFDGTKMSGTLGSGDVYSRETDRINYLHGLFSELCEDMESVAALKVCEMFNVDRLALRIISNNELTAEEFDPNVCGTLQHFVISLVNKILDLI